MTRNWTLTFYKPRLSETIDKQFVILDRTESEANNESMRYIENFGITKDWTLMPATNKEAKTLPDLS